MAVTDWSQTAASNTTIGSIPLGENLMDPGDVNDAIREMMAQIAAYVATLTDGSNKQPLDATLTALAGITVAANKLIYATGADTFATTDITPFARTILDDADAAAVRATIGAGQEAAVSGTGTSGKIDLGGGFTMTWKNATFSGTTSHTYGGGHTYTSWAKAWIEGEDTAGTDVSVWVTSAGLSSATVRNGGSGTGSGYGVLFSIGV